MKGLAPLPGEAQRAGRRSVTLIRYDPDIISVRVWANTASSPPSPSYRTMTSSALSRPGLQVIN
uniref:hypothetical protein n=1 Tax=Klebsiella variicola TaxID=244366 RepID=UPI003FA5EDE4